jgi:hypothetical protein
VTGEALYTDDVPLPPGTLHAALVTSARPHAKLLSVDASAALQARSPVVLAPFSFAFCFRPCFRLLLLFVSPPRFFCFACAQACDW